MLNYFSEKSLHSTDQKGRLLLPKDVRASHKLKGAEELFLLPSLSDPPYLEIRTSKQWDAYRKSLKEGEAGEQKKDSYRYAMMFKEKAKLDAQGRVTLPPSIRDACDLNGSVAVIDMEDHVEVWSVKHVQKKYADLVRAFKARNDEAF